MRASRRFILPVENTVVMAVRYTPQQLIHEGLGRGQRQGASKKTGDCQYLTIVIDPSKPPSHTSRYFFKS